jgi:hypothetical protein
MFPGISPESDSSHDFPDRITAVSARGTVQARTGDLATARQLVTVRVRGVRVRALGERLRFGLPKIPTAGGLMSVRPPATGGERLRLRSSSPNQTSLVLSPRRPRLTLR